MNAGSINGVTNKALLAYMGLKDWPEKQENPSRTANSIIRR